MTFEADESHSNDELNEFDEFTNFGDVSDGCARDDSLRRTHAQLHQPERARGLLVNHQSVTLAVWLGIPVLALVWAALDLWRTSRLLNKVQQDRAATQVRLMPAPVPELTSVFCETTSSAIAS